MGFSKIVVVSCALMAFSGVSLANDDAAKDAKITSDVKAKITSGTNVPTVDAPNVVVFTKDAKVTLMGIVDTKTQKEDIKKIVKAIDGVKDIKDDEIIVKGD